MRVAVAYVLIVEVGLQLLFGRVAVLGLGTHAPLPRGVLLQGAVVGLLYALVAFGLVLVHRASRILNFAQAAIGAAPAVAGIVLVAGRGYPFLAGLAIAIAGAALAGAAVEVGVIRRFRDAPRLVLSVATLGLGLFAAFVEFNIPKWLTGNALLRVEIASPFRGLQFNLGITRFTGDAIFAAVVVAVSLVALHLTLRSTDVGLAIRASAEREDSARLIGIPVDRLSTFVWAVGAVLSAMAIFLRASLVGLPVGTSVGPSVLLFGLAAAVIARMESFPVALGAALALGALEQSAQFATNSVAPVWAVLLAVVLGALLLQRRQSSRPDGAATSSFRAVGEVSPIATALRSLPEMVWARRAVIGAVGLLAIAAPYLVTEGRRGLETTVVLHAMIGVSLVVLTGWTGQISLGQFAFAGAGAAVAGAMSTTLHADFFVTLLVSGLAGAGLAILVGLPALRIQGLYLAVTTLAFAFVVEALVLNPRYFGWLLLDEGEFVERPVLYGFWSTESTHRFYYVCLAFLLLVIAFASALRRNRGRILIGLRENEAAMQSFGVRVATNRLTAFAISGFIAALAGALMAYQRGSVTPTGFPAFRSLDVFVMTVVGGVGTIAGAVTGAIVVLGVPLLPVLSHVDQIEELTTSAGLLFVLYYLPGGLSQVGYRLRDLFVDWVARRNGMQPEVGAAPDRTVTLDQLLRPTTGVEDPNLSAIDLRGGLPYADYLRLAGLAVIASGLAWAASAWPGVFVDYPDANRGLLIPILAASGLAVLARRAGTSPWQPGRWFARRGLITASVYRSAVRRTEVNSKLLGQFAALALGGPLWIAFTAWRNFDDDDVAAVLQWGLGLAYVLIGLVMFAAAPKVVAAVEQARGARYVIGGHGRLLGRSPRLVTMGPRADELRAAAEATGAQLSCAAVEAGYDHVQVLFGCDVEVRPGEILALLGTNGAGKSTLLRAISGLCPPTGGVVLLDGTDISEADPGAIARLGLGHVPGGRAIFPSLTVAEHLRLAAWVHRDDPAGTDAARDEVYELFPRLRERVRQRAGDLSGGEQQMLAIGVALVTQPRVLMIDELSLGLAPVVVEQLLAAVRRLRDKGTTIVIVEQSLHVAAALADRAYFLEKGEVRFEGTCAELLGRDDLARAVFLRPGDPVSSHGDIGSPVGPTDEASVLAVRGVEKRFGGVVAVAGAHFDVEPHEIVGLIGANGAGKTTVLDIISGFVTPDTGAVVLDGRDVTDLSPDARARLGLGRSFQDARLLPSLSVAENLAVALDRHLAYGDLLAAGFDLPEIRRDERNVAWTTADLIELMQLGDYRDRLVRELSTGTRRVVDLAMAMAHDPELLLLDEPSAGIAQREVEALVPVLLRLRREAGCAMVIVEHDIPLISSVADRLVAFDAGIPIASGPPAEVIADPLVVAAYLGADPAALERSDPTAARPKNGTRRKRAVALKGRT